MKLRLADWSNVAEILSGIAVVVTLVLLVVGVRDNTQIARVSMYDSAISGMNEWRAQIVDSRDVVKLWQAIGSDEFEKLDEFDQLRALQLGLTQFGVYEKAFFAKNYNVIGDDEWDRFENMICFAYDGYRSNAQMLLWFERGLSETFYSYILASCISP